MDGLGEDESCRFRPPKSVEEEDSGFLESRAGAVVRALASHQCGPGSNPGPGVICGLSLLLVLALL